MNALAASDIEAADFLARLDSDGSPGRCGLRGVCIRLSRAACASRTSTNGSLLTGAVAGRVPGRARPRSSLADRLLVPLNRAGIREIPETRLMLRGLRAVLPGWRRKTPAVPRHRHARKPRAGTGRPG